MNITEKFTSKTISGIDTLYFFYETNGNYISFFNKITSTIQNKKIDLETKNIFFENKDIKITINNHLFEYKGVSQGFYWFNYCKNYFTIGCKDPFTNKNLHNIQVQLNAIGIYTIGLKSVLRLCDIILNQYTTGYKPITRVDLNIFIQTDLSWITKDMFVTRKRQYISHIKEISSKYKLQTLYIGKDPFMLRIYDKQAELKKSQKKEIMYTYFLMNNFDNEKSIYNIEFELHRKFLKTYSIDTIDELLSTAEKLFSECMHSIRLVDLSTISKKSIKSYNRYKAKTHLLWEYICKSYELKDFLQDNKKLLKIKRKEYFYTEQQAINEHIDLAKRAYMYNIVIDEHFYKEVLIGFRKKYGFFHKELHSLNEDQINEVR